MCRWCTFGVSTVKRACLDCYVSIATWLPSLRSKPRSPESRCVALRPTGLPGCDLLRHQRRHVFWAVNEGTACGTRQVLELLGTPENPAGRLVAVVGGTQGQL